MPSKSRPRTCPAPPHTANDDEVADDEPQEGSNQDADSNPHLSTACQDELEDELEPWVDYTARATHTAG